MKDRIDMSYFALGNRDFKCINSYPNLYKSTSSVKSTASNLMQRNYLEFDPGIVDNTTPLKEYSPYTNKELSKGPDVYYKYHPEYKYYHNTNEQNKTLNNYLNPVNQYIYRDNPMIKSAEQLLCIQRRKTPIQKKEYPVINTESDEIKWRNENKTNIGKSQNLKTYNNDYTIPLKNPKNENILVSNDYHLACSTNAERRIKPPVIHDVEDLKYNSYLESKLSPEYLRNYDKESLKNIDKYYIDRKENVHILSRFGNWITLKPDDKNRSHALEKVKHGTYETSLIAPDWMDIGARRKNNKYENEVKSNINNVNNVNNNNEVDFKAVLYHSNVRDNTNLTILQDKDQKNVLPLYLMDSYEKNKILLDQNHNNNGTK